MKISFERETIAEIVADIYAFVDNMMSMGHALPSRDEKPKVEAPPPVETKPEPPKPVEAKPKNKGGRPKGYSPKKNGAAVAAPKAKAKAKAPEPKPATPPDEIEEPEQGVSFEDLELPQPEPEPEPEQLTPTQLAAIRVKTTEELQQAYASGKHKQVLELLKKHGNGAKSFRELHIEDFVPIRKAIDDGALA